MIVYIYDEESKENAKGKCGNNYAWRTSRKMKFLTELLENQIPH
jgi:hypothetical protein